MRMPGGAAGVVALNEVLVHGWDLAVATGQQYRADPVAAQACLEFGEGFAVGAPEARDQIYGPVVPVPDDAPCSTGCWVRPGATPAWAPPSR